MDDISETRRAVTSYGDVLVIKRLELVDEKPEVLGCGLLVLLEAELDGFAAMTPPERAKAWQRRLEYLAHEREERRKNPARTIWWPWTGPEGTELAEGAAA